MEIPTQSSRPDPNGWCESIIVTFGPVFKSRLFKLNFAVSFSVVVFSAGNEYSPLMADQHWDQSAPGGLVPSLSGRRGRCAPVIGRTELGRNYSNKLFPICIFNLDRKRIILALLTGIIRIVPVSYKPGKGRVKFLTCPDVLVRNYYLIIFVVIQQTESRNVLMLKRKGS